MSKVSEQVGKISEQTLVPIGLVITALGGVGWLSTMHANGSANTAAISEIKTEQVSTAVELRKISNSLARIEERLRIKRPLGQEE